MPQQRRSRTTPEALQALRERLQATQEAAQKLAEDAANPKPPPSGWDVPRSAQRAGDELDALVGLVSALTEVLPPELRAQLAELVRQLLTFVRAVLDWWIERLEGGPRRGDAEVEDIPIS
jgi:hypothetical protein